MTRDIGNLPRIFVGWFLLCVCFLLPFGSAQPLEPISKEQSDSATENTEDYWTPERLKKAKPLELPHSTTPPSHLDLPKEEVGEHPPSVQGSGNTGEGSVDPNEKKHIFKDSPMEESEIFSN
jgi:hypothetical protein